jgi:tetratricopeptide (TPR) repeat protein
MASSSSSQPAPPAPPPLSEYSLEPYPAEEVARFKHVLESYKFDGCSPVELSDAYESLGLSQLLNGDYAEAATNLECACTIQEDTLKTATDANVDHRHATKFWCGVAFMRVGQLNKAEAVFSHLLAHIQKKRSDLFVAANSNMALLLVQLNKRKDLAVKHASAAVQVVIRPPSRTTFIVGLDGRQHRPLFPSLYLLYTAAPIQAASRMHKPHAPELLAPRRVLLHVLLHFGEYSHAEVVVDEARDMAPLEQVRRAPPSRLDSAPLQQLSGPPVVPRPASIYLPHAPFVFHSPLGRLCTAQASVSQR